mmetsp:Transcript_62239/g.184075  ORF Transcript_62239/g.184075 Transcript_62239/m.184075 type:complete len:275 (-) Transcript_62239:3411-4235(-)
MSLAFWHDSIFVTSLPAASSTASSSIPGAYSSESASKTAYNISIGLRADACSAIPGADLFPSVEAAGLSRDPTAGADDDEDTPVPSSGSSQSEKLADRILLAAALPPAAEEALPDAPLPPPLDGAAQPLPTAPHALRLPAQRISPRKKRSLCSTHLLFRWGRAGDSEDTPELRPPPASLLRVAGESSFALWNRMHARQAMGAASASPRLSLRAALSPLPSLEEDNEVEDGPPPPPEDKRPPLATPTPAPAAARSKSCARRISSPARNPVSRARA